MTNRIVNSVLFCPRKQSVSEFESKVLAACPTAKIVNFRASSSSSSSSSSGKYTERVRDSEDDVRLFGALVKTCPEPASWSDDRIFLLSHGNAALASDECRTELVYRLSLHGSVFVYDYRGYGCSGNPASAFQSYAPSSSTSSCSPMGASCLPTVPGVIADAEAAWRFLTETQRIAPQRIVLVGHSLGCAVNCSLLRGLVMHDKLTPPRKDETRRLPRSMLLWAPFWSVGEMARGLCGNLLGPAVMYLSGVEWSNDASLGVVRRLAPQIRVVVLHGIQDTVVPWKHGQQLAVKHQCFFVPLDTGTHCAFADGGRSIAVDTFGLW